MRRATRNLIFAALALGLPPVANGATATKADAVTACVKSVRATDHDFDAYLGSDDHIHYWASPRAIFYFGRCMDEHGWPQRDGTP
jgi:hypothetical protein